MRRTVQLTSNQTALGLQPNMRFLLAIALSIFCSTASCQVAADPAPREIGGLFARLEQSNCQFSRNGSWYDAKQASAHLRQKYDYLVKRHLVTSAESFIDLAASKSSMSGKAYLVRCADKPAIESKVWFTHELEALRSKPAAP
jgi:Family of unknown function (DUF5329)